MAWAALLSFWAIATALAAPLATADSISDAVEKVLAMMSAQVPKDLKTVAVKELKWESPNRDDAAAFRLFDDIELALSKTERFRLINRAMLDKIVEEIKFTRTDLVDPTKVKEFGRLKGVDCFLYLEVLEASRTLPEFQNQDLFTRIKFRAISVRTSTLCSAGVLCGINEAALKPLLPELTKYAANHPYRDLAAAIARWLPKGAVEPLKIETISIWKPDNPQKAQFDDLAFEDYLLSELVRSPGWKIVDRRNIEDLMKEKKLVIEGILDEKLRGELARLFSIDAFLLPRVVPAPDGATQVTVYATSVDSGISRGERFVLTVPTALVPRKTAPPMPEAPAPKPLPPQPPPAMELPPRPRPEAKPLPEEPEPRPAEPEPEQNRLGRTCWWKWGLCAAIATPRDLVDTVFIGLDRLPLAGALTTAVYKYGGIAIATRLGAGERYAEVWQEIYPRGDSESLMTWGGFASKNPRPTYCPRSKHVHDLATKDRAGAAAAFLLSELIVLTPSFDAVDLMVICCDRIPLLGLGTTALYRPLSVFTRSISGPGSWEDRTEEMEPVGKPGGKFTYGLVLGDLDPWPLFPNWRAWNSTVEDTERAKEVLDRWREKNRTIERENLAARKEWQQECARIRDENDKANARWKGLMAEAGRSRSARQAWEKECEAIRKGNDEAKSRHETALADLRKAEAEAKAHNDRAETVELLLKRIEKDDLSTRKAAPAADPPKP